MDIYEWPPPITNMPIRRPNCTVYTHLSKISVIFWSLPYETCCIKHTVNLWFVHDTEIVKIKVRSPQKLHVFKMWSCPKCLFFSKYLLYLYIHITFYIWSLLLTWELFLKWFVIAGLHLPQIWHSLVAWLKPLMSSCHPKYSSNIYNILLMVLFLHLILCFPSSRLRVECSKH